MQALQDELAGIRLSLAGADKVDPALRKRLHAIRAEMQTLISPVLPGAATAFRNDAEQSSECSLSQSLSVSPSPSLASSTGTNLTISPIAKALYQRPRRSGVPCSRG